MVFFVNYTLLTGADEGGGALGPDVGFNIFFLTNSVGETLNIFMI